MPLTGPLQADSTQERSGRLPADGRELGPRNAIARPLRSYLELGPFPSAVPCARVHAKQLLWEWGLESVVEAVELVVSELVTNGVQASARLVSSRYQGRWTPGVPPVRLSLCSDRKSVLIRVWDGNDQRPERKDADPEALGGRGLLLVEALSVEWGTYTPERSSGKVVWALMAVK